MLIEFSVQNFLSFNERVTLSLVAAPEVDAVDQLQGNTFEVSGEFRLLKSALIYGANASGKSNLVKAMKFAKRMVLYSAKDTQSGEPIAVTPFLLGSATKERGSSFEFLWMSDGARYRYEFTVDAARVLREALFRARIGEESGITLFERDASGIRVGEQFVEGRGIESKTRANALFLSVVAQFNGEEAEKVLAWFRKGLAIASGLDDRALLGFTMHQIRAGAWIDEILRLTREADLGITSIAAIDITPDLLPQDVSEDARRKLLSGEFGTLQLRHRAFDAGGMPSGEVEFNLGEESEGTQKFIALAGPLLDVLKNGATLFIDELDARLHPRLIRAIVHLFHSESNKNNAQLIAVTHDTNLLDRHFVRRDQIWFTEKDRYGGTKLYSLAEFDLPSDARYERDYLLGKYGAVPNIGELVAAKEET